MQSAGLAHSIFRRRFEIGMPTEARGRNCRTTAGSPIVCREREAMNLWIPAGADLGEFAPPDPDPLMVNFIGGFDQQGRERPMTYRRLRDVADSLTITSTTPDGPATLLETAREMFALSFYQYNMLLASATFSIFAVEAALKVRLGAQGGFQALIRTATAGGLITSDVADVVDTGRHIRNNFVHEGAKPLWSFAMAYNGIGASYRLVRELYPEGT